ncbi:MAG: RNA polymerase sigma factor [Pseudomonadota bacterium]
MSELELADTLMQKAARGNRRAMDQLYGLLATPLYNYLLRLSGDPDLANDALQNTFLQAWQSRDTFRGDGARPWLFVIARNASRRLRTPPVATPAAETADPGADPAAAQTARETAAQLEHALAKLPEDTREAIVLSRVAGLDLDEIAGILGTTNGALRVRLSRGLAALKKELEL